MNSALTSDWPFLGVHRLTPYQRQWAGKNQVSTMTRKEKSRREIHRQFAQCGWWVQRRAEMSTSASFVVAVRESSGMTGEADYLHLREIRRPAS